MSTTDDMGDEILAIFVEEAREVHGILVTEMAKWLTAPHKQPAVIKEIRRNFHTLKGSGRMAKAEDIAALAYAIEEVLNQVLAGKYVLTQSMIEFIPAVVKALPDFILLCEAKQPLTPLLQSYVTQAQQLQADPAAVVSIPVESAAPISAPAPVVVPASSPIPVAEIETPSSAIERDPELLGIFLEETKEILERANHALQHWTKNPTQFGGVGLLQRELHTLKGSARMMEFPAIADLAHALENVYSAANQAGGPSAQAVIALSERAFDRLDIMSEALRSNGLCPRAVDLIDACNALLNAPSTPSVAAAPSASIPSKSVSDKKKTITKPKPAKKKVAAEPTFLTKSEAVLRRCDDDLQHWLANPAEVKGLEKIQHYLAELAIEAKTQGQTTFSTLSAELSRLLKAIGSRQLTADDQIIALLQEAQHWLSQMLQQIARTGQVQSVPKVLISIEKLLTDIDNVAIKRLENRSQTTTATTPASISSSTSSVMAEVVRVRADVLNMLFNLVGESDIIQGRLTEYVIALETTLQDATLVVERLRSQLRQIEFEAQIRQNLMITTENELDPLEMEQYTPLQELVRSLNESVADLLGLRDNLRRQLHNVKVSVGQQDKVHTALQEGLMHTRMVSFASIVPRLQRITRQVGQELAKQVNLEIVEADNELERSVLERLLAPLEHMLRNAIAHGIETPDAREKQGKPETGNIRLRLLREGQELVLEMADDGGGIHLEKVRQKAIEKNLLDPNKHLSVDEIMAFIFEPGFSTASQVTQIAGRGVGMDVVRQQVKALGGTLAVTSSEGKGTTFTIRFPFSLSVNTAVLVCVGSEVYAVPMPMIEGIIRVQTEELKQAYTEQPSKLHYAGHHFDLVALRSLILPSGGDNISTDTKLSLPVLLVRVGMRSIAIFVDSWLGSQEVVVKPLGRPFGETAGIAGTAVLADGRIVVVLDLPALLQHCSSEIPKLTFGANEAANAPLILVVDDSVTVRKVSIRFLTRLGYRVETAKDGIEAQEFLQTTLPDLILLDVEMPRMDGFELASYIRATDNLKHIPIIMITSRTGTKHRERAQAIGVQGYLGKPFQDPQLLELMQTLLKDKS